MLVFMMLTAVASAVAARNARRGEKFPGGASHTPRTPRHGKVRPQLCFELGWVGIAVFPAKIIQLAQSSSKVASGALARHATWRNEAPVRSRKQKVACLRTGNVIAIELADFGISWSTAAYMQVDASFVNVTWRNPP